MQLLAAAEFHPGFHFDKDETERNGSEVCPAGVLAFPVIVGGDVGLAVAGGDFVERIEGADTFAGCEVFDLNLTLGQFRNTCRQALCTGAKAREITAPGRDNNHFLPARRNRGCRQR